MSPLVTLPYQLEDGVDLALGSEVIGNLNSILAVLNGGIRYDNLDSNPDFPGTCISSTVGRRLPTASIEDDAVTAAKLADATSDVDDALRAVTGDHVRLEAIGKKHINTLSKLTYSQLDILAQTTAVSFTCAVQISNSLNSTGAQLISHSVERATSGANYVFNVRASGVANGFTPIRVGAQTSISPATPIPSASYLLVAAYLADVTYNTGTGAFTANLITVALKIA